MGLDLAKDLDTFLSPDDFGETALYDGTEVPVQFYRASERLYEYRMGTYDSPSGGLMNAAPFALARSSDLPGVGRGSILTIGGKEYRIDEIEYRRDDLLKLHLSERTDRPFNA